MRVIRRANKIKRERGRRRAHERGERSRRRGKCRGERGRCHFRQLRCLEWEGCRSPLPLVVHARLVAFAVDFY